jgi:hypothetical protein
VGPVAHTVFGTLLKKIQNYEYKIGYDIECLFRMGKTITTNYKFITLTDRTNFTKTRKIKDIFIIYLTHLMWYFTDGV